MAAKPNLKVKGWEPAPCAVCKFSKRPIAFAAIIVSVFVLIAFAMSVKQHVSNADDHAPPSSADPIVLISCMAFHYEILLGFASQLQTLGYLLVVFAKFKEGGVLTEQGASAKDILEKQLNLPFVFDITEFHQIAARRVIFISAQEEAKSYPYSYRHILNVIRPKIVYNVVHDINTANPAHLAAIRFLCTAHRRSVFLTLSPLALSVLKGILAQQNLKPYMQDWILPIHPYQFRNPCLSASAKCLQHFAVQGSVQAGSQNNTRLLSDIPAASPQLHPDLVVQLLGQGELSVSEPLQARIQRVAAPGYQEYFERIHHSIALLTHSDSSYRNGSKVSSAVPAALTSGTPILAGDEVLAAHSFLPRNASFVVARGESEVGAMMRVLSLGPQHWLEVKSNFLANRDRLMNRSSLLLKQLMDRGI